MYKGDIKDTKTNFIFIVKFEHIPDFVDFKQVTVCWEG